MNDFPERRLSPFHKAAVRVARRRRTTLVDEWKVAKRIMARAAKEPKVEPTPPAPTLPRLMEPGEKTGFSENAAVRRTRDEAIRLLCQTHPIPVVVAATGLSRQRIYQILNFDKHYYQQRRRNGS